VSFVDGQLDRPQIPGQTNVNNTWNFNGSRFPPAQLAALGTSLTILWTLWVVKERQKVA